MIALSESAWKPLMHAHGSATDIPPLLLTLLHYPRCVRDGDEPWHTLWSSLCMEHTIYDASIAAVPHILMIAEAAPWRIDDNFLCLPICIEICRKRDNSEFDASILNPYLKAMAKIPSIVHATMDREWNEEFCRVSCAALAVAKGHWEFGNAVLGFDPTIRVSSRDWMLSDDSESRQ